MGFKMKDGVTGFPNSDPLRIDNSELLPEACAVDKASELSYLTMTTKQYYLSADFSPDNAQPLSERALAPLYRRVRC